MPCSMAEIKFAIARLTSTSSVSNPRRTLSSFSRSYKTNPALMTRQEYDEICHYYDDQKQPIGR